MWLRTPSKLLSFNKSGRTIARYYDDQEKFEIRDLNLMHFYWPIYVIHSFARKADMVVAINSSNELKDIELMKFDSSTVMSCCQVENVLYFLDSNQDLYEIGLDVEDGIPKFASCASRSLQHIDPLKERLQHPTSIEKIHMTDTTIIIG